MSSLLQRRRLGESLLEGVDGSESLHSWQSTSRRPQSGLQKLPHEDVNVTATTMNTCRDTRSSPSAREVQVGGRKQFAHKISMEITFLSYVQNELFLAEKNHKCFDF